MPTYDYRCDKCDTSTEICHSIKSEEKYFCEKCRTELYRVPVLPFYVINKEGGYADFKEAERKKLTSDRDRAVKRRKRLFGSEAVGTPCDRPAERHLIKGRTIARKEQELDRETVIKALAKDGVALERAKQALKKAENKKK